MPYFKSSDNSVHFLSDDDVANGGLTLLPQGCQEMSNEEFAAHQAQQVATLQSVPQEVSRFQGRAALIQAGHMAAIQAYIDQPTTDIMVKEAWANVTVFRRQSPMILTVASVLNLSDEDLDNLFITAHAIGDV